MNSSLIAFGTKSRKRAAARVERRSPARVARRLALAHALQHRVDSGEFTNYADLASALGFTRARVTQIMDLLLLAPDIQEEILFLEVMPGAQPLSERVVRSQLLRSLVWEQQRAAWQILKREPKSEA